MLYFYKAKDQVLKLVGEMIAGLDKRQVEQIPNLINYVVRPIISARCFE